MFSYGSIPWKCWVFHGPVLTWTHVFQLARDPITRCSDDTLANVLLRVVRRTYNDDVSVPRHTPQRREMFREDHVPGVNSWLHRRSVTLHATKCNSVNFHEKVGKTKSLRTGLTKTKSPQYSNTQWATQPYHAAVPTRGRILANFRSIPEPLTPDLLHFSSLK